MSRCQVCGMLIKDGDINCPLHQHVHKRSLALEKWIWRAELGIISSKDAKKYLLETPASELAKEFDVSIATVYRHLRLAGFKSMRGWTKRVDKNEERHK